jgi:hypothetical protein
MELDPLSALFARDEEEAARYIPYEFLDAATAAMRFALTNDCAPARCRKKACQRQGRCHFVLDAEGDGVCPRDFASRDRPGRADAFLR